MSRLWHLLRLNRITIQIALVVFIGGIVSATAISLFLVLFRPDYDPPEIRQTAAEIASIARVLNGLPRAERPRIADLYHRDGVAIELDAAIVPRPLHEDSPLLSSLRRELPKNITIVAVSHPDAMKAEVTLQLEDGQSILVRRDNDRGPGEPGPLPGMPARGGPGPGPGEPGPPPRGPPPEGPGPGFGPGPGPGALPLPPGSSVFPPFPPLIVSLSVLVALTVALSIWAVLRIVAPLARFATAVEQFGLRGEGGPLHEEGTAEVRKATNAFNRMRERIQRLIEDRTRMMIAISHDLRTPLTRLRLRAEDIPESAVRQGMLRDMDLMEASIAGAVAYLREGSIAEPREMADLPSLIETICDQFTDAGFAVSYDGPQRLAVSVRPQAITRAMTNLIENGTKYGSTVMVRLGIRDERWAQIDVEDDGPGVPDSEKNAVLQPFYRSSVARESVGGFGLGLAIALDVARLHGGTLTLHDNRPRGLCVRMRLPLDDVPATAEGDAGIARHRP